jgi:hypothetical protein
MKIFWFVKPPLLEIKTYEEVISKYRKPKKIINVNDVLPMVETGDIFTFIGKVEKNYQMTIKWFTGSPVSHIGICKKEGDKLWIIEATRDGFTISDLHDRVDYFAYQYPLMIYRKLHVERDETFYQNFERFIEKNKDKEYTPMNTKHGVFELIKSSLDIRVPLFKHDLFHNKEDLTTLFCSELVAEAYGELGILELDDYTPSNEFTPADFSRINEHIQSGPEREKLNNLKKGAYLDEEIFVHIERDNTTSSVK